METMKSDAAIGEVKVPALNQIVNLMYQREKITGMGPSHDVFIPFSEKIKNWRVIYIFDTC